MSSNEAVNILIVEDEENVALTLAERLTRDGFAVTLARSQAEAVAKINMQAFALALLDVGLPDGSGFHVARILRAKQSHCAMVFLTAFSGPEDRIAGLELGAEDYIAKPFHFRELSLRLQNVLKRAQRLMNTGPHALSFGKARIHFAKFEVESDGATHSLSHKECALLKYLFDRRGQVVSRDEILNAVWEDDEFPTPRTVDNFIVRLRRLIEVDVDAPRIIKSVRGVGYQIIDDKE